MEHIDSLGYVQQAFRARLRQSLPCDGAAGFIERTDQPRHLRPRLARDRLNTRPMIRLLKRVQPHLCVATHFLPAGMDAWLIGKKKLRARNAIVDHSLEAGAAIRCNNLLAATGKIATLLDDPARLDRMREAAGKLGKPAAAVAEDALRLLD